MSDQRIEEAVNLAVENKDLSNYKIRKHGNTSNGEGYLGNIAFVTVTGTDEEDKLKSLDLVIKTSKESKTLRQQTPMKELFAREIRIYSCVRKIFEHLQSEMGVQDLLNVLPHCYATQILKGNESEMLVLENVKSLGYSTWDRMLPMTHKHIKLILEAYGQWHAFSFALKTKRRDIFEELTKCNVVNMFSEFLISTSMVDLTLELFEEARDACFAPNDKEMLNKLMMSKDDVLYILTDLFLEDPDYRVISHGDCWSNNFMFKPETNPTEPRSVYVLDWQFSSFSSPVMDLCHFIYACCNTEIQKDVSELLKLYYNSLRKSLKLLGCDPEEVFPYSKLVEHWRRFSKYGLLIQPLVLKFSMCDEQEAPDFAEAAEQGKAFLDNFNVEISHKEEYLRRVRANFIHYVRNLEISSEN